MNARIADKLDEVITALHAAQPPSGARGERERTPLPANGSRERQSALTSATEEKCADCRRRRHPVGESCEVHPRSVKYKRARQKAIPYQLFPEETAVVRPKRIPSARVTDEADVKGVEARHFGDFLLAAAVERMQQRDGLGDLEGLKITWGGQVGRNSAT